MTKKLYLSILFCFTSAVILYADGYGNILLVDDRGPSVLIHVNYTITKNNGQLINGISNDEGWIKFNEPINENFILLLDFDSDDWDWAGDPDEINALGEKLTELGYEMVFGSMKRGYSRTVKIKLDGKKKYILCVGFQTYRISE